MKLHIGCGKKFLPGYKHVDVISYDHVDFVCDARHLHFIKDSSVSEIYACHILEHFRRTDLPAVLNEWYRVLKDFGIIRIAVPDFGSVVSEYIKTKNLASLYGLLYGGQSYDYNFHHIAFDFETLQGLLEKAGYGEVRRYDWQSFLPDGYDDYSRAYLPHMDMTNGRLMSLNVICKKIGVQK